MVGGVCQFERVSGNQLLIVLHPVTFIVIFSMWPFPVDSIYLVQLFTQEGRFSHSVTFIVIISVWPFPVDSIYLVWLLSLTQEGSLNPRPCYVRHWSWFGLISMNSLRSFCWSREANNSVYRSLFYLFLYFWWTNCIWNFLFQLITQNIFKLIFII